MSQNLRVGAAPLVSVILPTCNDDPRVLAESIESVLSQTMVDFELVVVDDNSRDSPRPVIEGYGDPRIRAIYRQENGGGAVARNTGTEVARGRYIAYLDSDDLWVSSKLEKQIAFMEERNSAFTYTLYDIIDEHGKTFDHCGNIPSSATYKSLLPYCFIRTSSILYDLDLVGEKVQFPSLRRRQDFGLFLRLLKRVPEARLVPMTLCSYRIRSGSLSSGKLGNIKYQWRIYREVEELSRSQSFLTLGQWGVRAGFVHLRRVFLKPSTGRRQ